MPTDDERRAVLGERERRKLLRGGLGLYTYPQIRSTTPVQCVAVIVVGTIVFLAGVMLFLSVWKVRAEEILAYGSSTSHAGGFAVSVAMLIIGIFWTHPGVIFFWRRFKLHRATRN